MRKTGKAYLKPYGNAGKLSLSDWKHPLEEIVFCVTFRLLRKEIGIKTIEVARKLGVSSAYISNKELHYHLSPAQAEQFAATIGFTATQILYIAQMAFQFNFGDFLPSAKKQTKS